MKWRRAQTECYRISTKMLAFFNESFLNINEKPETQSCNVNFTITNTRRSNTIFCSDILLQSQLTIAQFIQKLSSQIPGQIVYERAKMQARSTAPSADRDVIVSYVDEWLKANVNELPL